MTFKASLVLVAVFTSVPIFAQPTQQPGALAKPAKAQDKLVCRLVNTTGSRLGGERVCKTRAEWEAESDRNREDFENAPRQPSADPSPSGPG